MKNERIVVLGIYDTVMDAENGVDQFRESGFRAEDISALLPTGDQTKQFAHSKATKAPEGATVGGATGAVLGGALGWLAGIGTLAIPGVGPLIAAGPIIAAISGAGVGGTVGALSGAIIGMGIPEYEAKRYEGRVKEGGILVSVHCDDNDWRKKAENIFDATGATDVSHTKESHVDSDSTDRDTIKAGNY